MTVIYHSSPGTCSFFIFWSIVAIHYYIGFKYITQWFHGCPMIKSSPPLERLQSVKLGDLLLWLLKSRLSHGSQLNHFIVSPPSSGLIYSCGPFWWCPCLLFSSSVLLPKLRTHTSYWWPEAPLCHFTKISMQHVQNGHPDPCPKPVFLKLGGGVSLILPFSQIFTSNSLANPGCPILKMTPKSVTSLHFPCLHWRPCAVTACWNYCNMQLTDIPFHSYPSTQALPNNQRDDLNIN